MPGFGDMSRSKTQVFSDIAAWLGDSYKNGIRLSGILYFHRISDVRVSRSEAVYLNMFTQLCGDVAISKVILVTTMWDKTPLDGANRRLQILLEEQDLWGYLMVRRGASCPHNNTEASARTIVERLVKPNTTIVTTLQKELVDERRTLDRTSAGRVVEIETLKDEANWRKQLQEIEGIEGEAMKMQGLAFQQVIREERDRLNRLIQEAEKDIRSDASTFTFRQIPQAGTSASNSQMITPGIDSSEFMEGLHALPQPVQQAFASLLEDEAFKNYATKLFDDLKSNARLRQETTMALLHGLGSIQETDIAVRGTSIGKDLIIGLQNLPQQLQETLSPLLEDESFMNQVQERFDGLKKSTELQQKTAVDLLSTLSSKDQTSSEDNAATYSATPQGNSDSSDLSRPSESFSGREKESDRRSTKQPLGDDKTTQKNPTASATPLEQRQISDDKFFDWSTLHSYPLPVTNDILEARYLAALSLWDSLRFNVSASGVGIDLEGFGRLLRNCFHKKDMLAFFRSTVRDIRLLPSDPPKVISPQHLLELDKNLFDTSKFSGNDNRLNSVVYGKSRYGTITLFEVTTASDRPKRIRPMAAMAMVPKIVLQKFSDACEGSSRTTLSMPENEIWKATKQERVDDSKRSLKPAIETHNGQNIALGVDCPLKMALSIGEVAVHKVIATVPQMVVMLQHKTELIEDIESTAVYAEQDGHSHGVQMVRGPVLNGHGNNKPQIIVFAPAKANWAEETLSWK